MVEKIRKQPILVAIIGLIIGFVSIVYIPVDDSNLAQSLFRVALSVIMFGIMILMGAKETLLNFKKDFWYTLRVSRYYLIIAFITGMLIFIPGLIRFGFSVSLLINELSYFVLCITIGWFEESLFRGVSFEGFLRKTGKSRKGIWFAVILSSLIFGAVHVHSYIMGGNYDLIGSSQAILKTLQTGVMGLLLAAIYLKTKNIWAIALVHTLNDFFLMQVNMFTNETFGGYVSNGSNGIATIVMYSIQLILYIPVIIKSMRIINSIKIPEYGVFKEK